MRGLLQRVASAGVSVDGQTVGDVLGHSHELMTIYDQHASDGSTRPTKRSGRWDSNPRPTTWKAAALDQTELLPRRLVPPHEGAIAVAV